MKEQPSPEDALPEQLSMRVDQAEQRHQHHHRRVPKLNETDKFLGVLLQPETDALRQVNSKGALSINSES
jgi:hypothetical protein